MAFHINKFDSIEEYQTFVQTYTMYPQLYCIGNTGKVYWASKKSEDPAVQGSLKFSCTSPQTISFTDASGASASLEISDNGIDWWAWDKTSYSFSGDVYVRGMNPSGFGTTSSSNAKFVFGDSTVPVSVSGNIMHLLDYTQDLTTLPGTYTFYKLFGSTPISDASQLELPVMTLTEGCYKHMFVNCTSLIAPPALPATTLANSCYNNMFYKCTSLTSLPSLPATTLAASCYSQMFRGCSSITTPPALPATTLAKNCYSSMFRECSSLTSAPALPATTLFEWCYNEMFENCSSLTSAPALPATNSAQYCYYGMFSGCTSLTSAPASLPATTLTLSCYRDMFMGCRGLTSAPTLPAMNLARCCYESMFQGCTGLTSAPDLPATTLDSECYDCMFKGCTGLTSAPDLPATELLGACYYEMFNGCTNLSSIKCLATSIKSGVTNATLRWVTNVAATGTFTKASSATWPSGVNGIPENWTTVSE